MPTYDFECEPCSYHIEMIQRHDAPQTHKCPICEQQTLNKIFINAPNIIVRGEPTSIAQQAERNTAKMGNYELEAKRFNDKVDSKLNDKQRSARERNRAIVSMTPEQQTHWVKTGERPAT
jgi:putative FmdB family regulatory protein